MISEQFAKYQFGAKNAPNITAFSTLCQRAVRFRWQTDETCSALSADHTAATYRLCSGTIHVNPPSLVRSLRQFGFAENLPPAVENLRHLTVTSGFKKLHIKILYLAINNAT